jgi:DNA polymerase III subunit epsilon
MRFSSPAWDSLVYWALDLETGGLDPKKDAVLAVGMVPIRKATIRLGEAWGTLVRPDEDRGIEPESVRAHQLVWGEVREAPRLAVVLPEIDRRIREGVLLVHHRALDVAFLRRAYARSGMRWPKPTVVDTVDLLIKVRQRRRFHTPELPVQLPTLNLSRARREYGLPEYQAHDALSDALAAAELFLVLRNVLHARTLRDLR